MSNRKRPELRQTDPPLRRIRVTARFTPRGPDRGDAKAFDTFAIEAFEYLNHQRAQQLRREKSDWARTRRERAVPLGSDRSDQGTSARSPTDSRPVTAAPVVKLPHANPEAQFRRASGLLRAGQAITNGLEALLGAAESGDLAAASRLAEFGVLIAGMMAHLNRQQPALVRQVAAQMPRWPVLASAEPGWEREAVEAIASLGLGSAPLFPSARLRTLRGADVGRPARVWATAAVRTIEQTQFRVACFGQLLRDFGSVSALTDFAQAKGWSLDEGLPWVSSALELPPLSTATVARWVPVVREVIRCELPEFHSLPEWDLQRQTARRSGRDTPGQVANAVLDDIVSALKGLAPVG